MRALKLEGGSVCHGLGDYCNECGFLSDSFRRKLEESGKQHMIQLYDRVAAERQQKKPDAKTKVKQGLWRLKKKRLEQKRERQASKDQ